MNLKHPGSQISKILNVISNLYPNSIYVPSSNDWMETTINLNSLISENSLMIKIEMFSGGGNNVYIDNLNLN